MSEHSRRSQRNFCTLGLKTLTTRPISALILEFCVGPWRRSAFILLKLVRLG
jgi:hypothetical protein